MMDGLSHGDNDDDDPSSLEEERRLEEREDGSKSSSFPPFYSPLCPVVAATRRWGKRKEEGDHEDFNIAPEKGGERGEEGFVGENRCCRDFSFPLSILAPLLQSSSLQPPIFVQFYSLVE